MDDIKSFVSMANLYYQGIDRIPEAGIPIGNGRMGSLIWMDEEEMHMQWNRVDVFANDASSQSFPEMDTDYSSGVGVIDINFGMKKLEGIVSEKFFESILILDGSGTISNQDETSEFRKEDSFFLPAGSGSYQLEGACDALITTVKEVPNLAEQV